MDTQDDKCDGVKRKPISRVLIGCCIFLIFFMCLLFLSSLGPSQTAERYSYLAQVKILEDYFSNLPASGREAIQPAILSKPISEFDNPQELVWKVYTTSGESTDYIWELYKIPNDLKYEFSIHEPSIKTWWFDWCENEFSGGELTAILIPTNEPALEVYNELGLPLPPDFSLDKVNENYDPFAVYMDK